MRGTYPAPLPALSTEQIPISVNMLAEHSYIIKKNKKKQLYNIV